ncbi:MAG: CubicO group peptidase (beta-lactamase class C family) [Marivirga sp.]|jgi:CubicO group peptidase (beta-lactamase class C family)
MKTLKSISLIILALVIWSAFICAGLIEGFLLRSITSENSTEAFIEATKEKIAEEFVGNFAITLIEDGEVADAYFYSIDEEIIDGNTVFRVASISKWLTAFGIMKLV